MADLPRFSASKIQRYAGCKSDYVSRYLLGMKPDVETSWAVFGSACHAGIEAGYNNEFPYTVADAVINKRFAELDTTSWIGYSKSQTQSKTYQVLDNFDYDLFSPEKLEYEFILPFSANGETLCEIHGFIDLWTTDNRIIDFKTNSKAPTRKDVDKSIQLALYAWAFWRITGDWPAEVAIYHLPTSRLIPADLYSLRDRIFDIEILIREMLELTPDTELVPCSSCNPFCALKNWGNSGN